MGGADETIELGAPPTGPLAAIVAQLREDGSFKADGAAGQITEAEGAQLNDTVRSLAGIVNATHGRMVLAMWQVIRTGWWDGGSILSAKHWLSLHWGTTSANIGRVTAVAKKAEAYPKVIDALVAGEITLEAAQLICGRIPTEFQSTFVDYARNMTMGQLRACTHSVPAPKHPTSGGGCDGQRPDNTDSTDNTDNTDSTDDSAAGTDEEAGSTTGADDSAAGTDDEDDGAPADSNEPVAGDHPSRVSFGERDDGTWALNANLSAEDGALVATALQEARDRAFHAAQDPDERLRLSWADALVQVARGSLDRSDAERANDQPTDRTLVHFHYEYGRLYPDGSDQPMPHALARQILCDTNLVGIGFRNGRPVDLGRKTRVIPDRLRRIVLRRDGGCVVPGCGATRGLEIHHRIHWQDGGRTDACNLVALCRAHHRAHHHGLLNIYGDPYDQLTFTNADARPICAKAPIVPTDTTGDALADQAQACGMTDPAQHRIGPVGGPLQRWSILPGAVVVAPRPPDLEPIAPRRMPSEPPVGRPPLVRRE